MKRYGILDDDGTVLRWVYQQPASCYRYIVEKIKRQKFDTTLCEEGTF